MNILTHALDKYAVRALGSKSADCVPFVTMVMLVGSGEDNTASTKRWSMVSDDRGNVHVVLRGLAACENFIATEAQSCLRSCYLLAAEVQDHYRNEVGLPEEDVTIAANGMRTTLW